MFSLSLRLFAVSICSQNGTMFYEITGRRTTFYFEGDGTVSDKQSEIHFAQRTCAQTFPGFWL